MNTYKITNITNLVGKRDVKFNSNIDIEYIDNMSKKIITVKPGDTIFLTIPTLPISIQRLRIKNMVTVVEITQTELNKIHNQSKSIVEKPNIIEKSGEQKTFTTIKKKINRKDEEIEIQKDE